MRKILKAVSRPKKGQVTVYIFGVMASLVIAAFVVVNIGKTAKDKTFADNAADAAALATCSIMSQCFNYVAQQNSDQQDKKTGAEGMQGADKSNPGIQGDQTAERPISTKYTEKNANVDAKADTAAAKATPLSDGDPSWDRKSQHEAKAVQDTEKSSEDDNKENRTNQQQRESDAMKAAHGDGTGDPENYYDKAISEGYKICFQNSGTHHRLGRVGSKMYEQFQKTLEPGMVQSGEPRTFFWVDGAGRAHMVTCIIQTEKPDKWSMNESQDNRVQTDQKFKDLQAKAKIAEGEFKTAEAGHIAGEAAPDSIDMASINPPNDAQDGMGQTNISNAANKSQSITNGLQGSQKKMVTNSKQSRTDQLKSVDNIQHSMTVRAVNFQFHMGSPVKSIIGDIDVMTFYPPVQASAMATFNYTGRGRINRGQDSGSDPNYECGLMAAF